MKRRDLLSMSAAAGAAAITPMLDGRAARAAAVGTTPATAAAARAQASVPPAGWDDNLAQPDLATNPPGKGLDRGLILGGGGVILLSFYMGYIGTLLKKGLDLKAADLIVGTSAGSVTATMMLTGLIDQFAAELELLATYPTMMTKLMPSGPAANPAQTRAQQVYLDATTADEATLLTLGRAAAMANNPAGPDAWPSHLEMILGGSTAWPSPALHITANDCYTMERLLISEASGVPPYLACAASTSMIGQVGPTWVKDRLCTDGGNCSTDAHADLAMGLKKAIVISTCDGTADCQSSGLRETGIPESLLEDIAKVKAGGTEVMLVVSGTPEGVEKIDGINDPKYIKPMIAKGTKMAEADFDKLTAFWG